MSVYSLFDSQQIEPLPTGRELERITYEKQPSAEALAIANIQSQYVRKALDELERVAPDKATILTAHLYPPDGTEPRQLKDIAAHLGISAGKASIRLAGAKSKFRGIISKDAKLRAYIGRGALVEAA